MINRVTYNYYHPPPCFANSQFVYAILSMKVAATDEPSLAHLYNLSCNLSGSRVVSGANHMGESAMPPLTSVAGGRISFDGGLATVFHSATAGDRDARRCEPLVAPFRSNCVQTTKSDPPVPRTTVKPVYIIQHLCKIFL